MKKLKTLKDIKEWVDSSSTPCVCNDAERMTYHLREAAKEHITELKKEVAVVYEEIGDDREVVILKAKIEILKHFFNLEDD